MRLIIDQGPFLRALSAAAHVVESRNTIPVLSNIRLEAGNGTLSLRATDLDIEAGTTVAAEVEEAGALTVPARTLRDIVAKLPKETRIGLAIHKGGRLRLSAGRARFDLPTLPVEDFPDLQAGAFSHSFTLGIGEALRIVQDLTFAISTEETRYYLNGIYLHVPPGAHRSEGLVAVATDGHRLARLRQPCPEGAEGMPGIILPRKLVAELARLVATEGGPALDIALSDRKIRITRDHTVLTSKLIEGTFPDYERVIPPLIEHRTVVDGRALCAALDRVSTLSRERGRAVRLAIDAEHIELTQSNPDMGDARDEVDAVLTGAPLTIGFNGAYLAEALGILDTETAELVLDTPGSPTIIRRRDDTMLTIVLMPMRVS